MEGKRQGNDNNNNDHASRVRAVAAQVRARPAGMRLTVRKASRPHTIHDVSWKDRCHRVDVGALDRILAIDEAARTATCEGQVTMGQLVAAALPLGLVPEVVPEYRDFTVAGLCCGLGIQSSSFRYGLQHEGVLEVEVVLGDGRVARCGPAQHADLFRCVFGSYGTLGIVTLAVLRLRPAKPFVRSRYTHFRDVDAYAAAFRAAVLAHDADFVEGVAFSRTHLTLITSVFAGDRDADADGAGDYDPEVPGAPYFYQHARTATQDVIATQPFLHRSERGGYWLNEVYADAPLLTDTWCGRRYLDYKSEQQRDERGFEDPSFSAAERERCLVLQDMGVNMDRLEEALRWIDERLGVYPLWNCPIRSSLRSLTLHPPPTSSFAVDFGVYGEPKVPSFRHRRDVRALQLFADYPSTWGISHLTINEFRKTYEKALYERVREEYGAEGAFLHLEDKITFPDGIEDDVGLPPIPNWRLVRAWRHEKAATLTIMCLLLWKVWLALLGAYLASLYLLS